jgi:hypothetical protein
MSGIVSLESSIRTCKVDVGYASRINSDRFLNPRNMVCPVWNSLDSAGRVACPDSFVTKSAGCNNPQDRVSVENSQRPNYIQYISDTLGNSYNGNTSVPQPGTQTTGFDGPTPVVGVREGFMNLNSSGASDAKKYATITGSAGDGLSGIVWPRTCGYDRYDKYSESIMK